MIACLLRAFGAWPGNAEWVEKDNMNTLLRDRIVRPFFRGMRCNLIGRGDTAAVSAGCLGVAENVSPIWRRRILQMIHGYGYEAGPWMYWGADACLSWPIWHRAFPDAKWVVVRRETGRIVNACNLTQYVKDVVPDIPVWADSYLGRFEDMAVAGCDIEECWPGRVFSGKLDTARALVTKLGMVWDDATANDALSPALWASGVFATTPTEGGWHEQPSN